VFSTAVGHAAGLTPNPTYEEVCSRMTGHNEVVLVVFDPNRAPYRLLLKLFWESHDPTQGIRQGNNGGTQYRSDLYAFTAEHLRCTEASRDAYRAILAKANLAQNTTEILPAPSFYYAEDYHQQYLAKKPAGYCGTGGAGIPLDEEFSTTT
jgi:peptide-methionine (S)-S-oxide reductase